MDRRDWGNDFDRVAATGTLVRVFDPWILVIALVIAFAAAVVQGSVGFGFAVTSAPLLALLDGDFVPVPIQLISIPLAVVAAVREWDRVDLSGVGWIITGRVPGSILAAWVLTVAAQRTVDLLIGGIVLIAVVAIGTGVSIPMTTGTKLVAGLTAGFSGTASSIGGPPIALLYRNEPGPTVRATMGLILAIGLCINVTVLTIAGLVGMSDLVAAAAIGPAAALGFLLSSRLTAHFDGAFLRRAILVVAATAAVALIARAVTG